MAVGDIVNGFGLISSVLIFQPAASVSIMISCAFNAAGNQLRLTNGTNTCYSISSAASQLNTKIFINNAIYLNLATGAGDYSGYTGIQIQ